MRVLVLPYIDSRAAQNRLDQVLGMDWKDEYTSIVINGQQAFQCALSIKVDGEWITRTDGAEATDIESVKGGYSNAFKRACVKFGISRYLYDLPQYWLPLENKGKVYVSGNVKGQHFKGYVNPPSVQNGGQPSHTQNHQPNSQTQPQNHQQQSPNNQQPRQQQQQTNSHGNRNSNQTQSMDVQLVNALQWIRELISGLGIGENLANGMLAQVGSNAKSLQYASLTELESLYHVLKPVHDFTMVCKNAQLSLEGILYYAQIILKQPIQSFEQLFFTMNYESGRAAIEMVLADQKQQKQQAR